MKRFLTALLALVLVLGSCAFAAADTENKVPVNTYCTERKWHWFDGWEPNGHGGHDGYCRWKYCIAWKWSSDAETDENYHLWGRDHWVNSPWHVACQFYDFTVNGENVTVDPVCGDVKDGEALARVDAQLGRKVALDCPQLSVHAGKTASGDEIMTACFEMSGIVKGHIWYKNRYENEPVGVRKVVLPSDFAGHVFTLVAEDGTESKVPASINADGTVTLTLDLSAPVLIHLG